MPYEETGRILICTVKFVQVIYKRREKKHKRDSTSFFMYNHSINNNIYNIGKCEV